LLFLLFIPLDYHRADVCCGGHCVCGGAFDETCPADEQPEMKEEKLLLVMSLSCSQIVGQPVGGICCFLTTLATEFAGRCGSIQSNRAGRPELFPNGQQQKNAILMGMCLKIKEKLAPFPPPSNWILTGFNQRVCGCPLDFPVLQHVEGNANSYFSRQTHLGDPFALNLFPTSFRQK
jgi:hypothetical protein